jgi:hypothetical protein
MTDNGLLSRFGTGSRSKPPPTNPVSVGGGTQGIWAGNKLFYRSNDDRIMVTNYSIESGNFTPQVPHLWSDVQIADTGVLPNFDVSADAEHVAVLMPAANTRDGSRRRVSVVLNFTDLLRERLMGP